MQETMTIKEVEEVIKMKLFTFIADYKGGTYISQYVAKTLEEALNLWINNVDFFTDKQLKSFKKYQYERTDLWSIPHKDRSGAVF